MTLDTVRLPSCGRDNARETIKKMEKNEIEKKHIYIIYFAQERKVGVKEVVTIAAFRGTGARFQRERSAIALGAGSRSPRTRACSPRGTAMG